MREIYKEDNMSFRSLEWIEPGVLRLLNQQLIPTQKVYVDYTDYQGVKEAIRTMVVRGAPAIADAAAYGMVLAARTSQAITLTALCQSLAQGGSCLEGV